MVTRLQSEVWRLRFDHGLSDRCWRLLTDDRLLLRHWLRECLSVSGAVWPAAVLLLRRHVLLLLGRPHPLVLLGSLSRRRERLSMPCLELVGVLNDLLVRVLKDLPIDLLATMLNNLLLLLVMMNDLLLINVLVIYLYWSIQGSSKVNWSILWLHVRDRLPMWGLNARRALNYLLLGTLNSLLLDWHWSPNLLDLWLW